MTQAVATAASHISGQYFPFFSMPLMALKQSETMNTIIQQLKEQFPEIYPQEPENGRYDKYKVLHFFGSYCAQHFEDEKTQEVLHTVNRIYQRKSLFTCNAIENEFLYALATQSDVSNLMSQLKVIPESLWEAYFKVLIETQKINSK